MARRQWVNNESGPTCQCGDPTLVKQATDGKWMLVCLTHTAAEGASWQLPKRPPRGLPDSPNDWPAFLWPEDAGKATGETDCDRFRKKHPWLWRWAGFKLRVTEALARYLHIHVDW